MSDQKKTDRGAGFELLILGILVGIAVTLPLFWLTVDQIVEIVRDRALEIIFWICLIVALLLLILGLRGPITRWLLGVSLSQGKDMAANAFDIADKVQKGRLNDVGQDLKELVLQLLAVYGWSKTRQRIIAIIIVFSGFLAAVLGSALLLQQNKLLAAQNANLDRQLKTSILPSILQEANRRLPLYGEISSVLKRIDEEVAAERAARKAAEDIATAEEIAEGFSENANAIGIHSLADPVVTEHPGEFDRNWAPVALSLHLYSDIVGLSLQLKPYPFFNSANFDTAQLATLASDPDALYRNVVFLSPERGTLLRKLIEAGVVLDADAIQDADFSYSDMRGVRAENPFFASYDAIQQFQYPEFSVCFSEDSATDTPKLLYVSFALTNSDFRGSTLAGLNFDPTGVRLDNARLSHVAFEHSLFDQNGFELAAQDAELYDVQVDVSPHNFPYRIALEDVEWRGFGAACIDAAATQKAIKDGLLQVDGHIRLHPFVIFSDGTYNGAEYELGQVHETGEYDSLLPQETRRFFVDLGWDIVPALDPETGQNQFNPEAFFFDIHP